MAGRGQTVVVAGGSLAGHSVVSELEQCGFDGEVIWARGDDEAVPYSRPALSKAFMQGILDEAAIQLPDVTLSRGRLYRLPACCTEIASTADRVLVGDEWIGFDALFACTGMVPRVPNEYAPISRVVTLRTLADARAIHTAAITCGQGGSRIAVVGAGLVGSEIAASLRTLGLNVVLIEQGQTPLQAILGKELGEFCLRQHAQHGIDMRMSTRVTALEPAGARSAVTVSLDDGITIEAGLVVLALGAWPVCGWLAGAGLDLTDGVRCDETLRTDQPRVFAAGDIANWPHPQFGRLRVEHWSNASSQGRHAATSYLADLTGKPRPAFAQIPYFWSEQYGLTYQVVGSTVGHDEVMIHRPGPGGRPFVRYLRRSQLIAAAGVNAPRELMSARAEIAERAR